jgi:NADH:ubiquinone oxidoreductase subunit K
MTYLFLVTLPLVIYLVGLVGYSFMSKNLIGVIIFLELMLLAIGLLLVVAGSIFDDFTGPLVALYMLPFAGAESAVAIALLVAYYPTNLNLKLLPFSCL